jgi:hypothetical protein
MLQEPGEPCLEQGLGRLLDPAAGTRQFIGPAEESLESFISVVTQEQSSGSANLGARAVTPANQSLPPGLGLDNHLLNHIVQPRQLARHSHARLAQQDEQKHGRSSLARTVANRPNPTVLDSLIHSHKPLN